MEFGIYLRPAKTYSKMIDLAQKAEKLGFQGAYLNDHVHGVGKPEDEYVEAWTAMTGIGVQTTKLRVGQIVLFNSLRNPAFLAKSIATLDQMTNGRYELMIGAGWNVPEYEGYDLMEGGRGMPSAKERVDRFEEAIQIIQSMLNNEKTSYDGKFWKLKEAINIPQPVQKPMRMSVGCGKPRMMNITAKYATGINLGGNFTRLSELINQFSRMASKNDKTLSDYYVSGFTRFNVTKTDEEAREIAKPIAERTKTTIDEVLKEHYIGNAQNIVDKVRKVKDMGVNMTVVIPPYPVIKDYQSIEYFHDNVMSQI
ncbi:MAG: LLM class flavin-dependent oxidoreductase [Candidatus Kariarchaeaceae archaeon]|jgi:alkanesulfonate monooxygenase SsuD/methylene tetrahydromethanopterin reductase-like flavin-dependent oxidoreductase (luciferase family)